MNLEAVARLLEQAGCPPGKGAEMAAQLDKRARQLAEEKGRSYEEALTHLLRLMAQGWAATAQTSGTAPPLPSAAGSDTASGTTSP